MRCQKSYWSLSKEARFKVWHQDKAAPSVTEELAKNINSHHAKEGKRKKRARGAKRQLAKPKSVKRNKKRRKNIVKEEPQDEEMPAALPPLDDGELMDLVQAGHPNVEHPAHSAQADAEYVVNEPVPRTDE